MNLIHVKIIHVTLLCQIKLSIYRIVTERKISVKNTFFHKRKKAEQERSPKFCVDATEINISGFWHLFYSEDNEDTWWRSSQKNKQTNKLYSQLSPCRHPAIADTRYYGQNSDPRRKRFDWKWLPLLRTFAITDTKRRPERVRYNESWL